MKQKNITGIGKVIVGEDGITITQFTFDGFGPKDTPYLFKGQLEALKWAKGKVDKAVKQAERDFKQQHKEMKGGQ